MPPGQFDKSASQTLSTSLKTKCSAKGHLSTYRHCDEVRCEFPPVVLTACRSGPSSCATRRSSSKATTRSWDRFRASARSWPARRARRRESDPLRTSRLHPPLLRPLLFSLVKRQALMEDVDFLPFVQTSLISEHLSSTTSSPCKRTLKSIHFLSLPVGVTRVRARFSWLEFGRYAQN